MGILAMLTPTKEYDISAAFSLLLESITKERQLLNDEGAKALQADKYDTAIQVSEIGRHLLDFQDEVTRLVGEWQKLEDVIGTAKRNLGETSRTERKMTESLATIDNLDSNRKVFIAPEALAAYQQRKQDIKNRESFTPPGRLAVPTTFQIKPGWVVRSGDWIEHETYGYVKIIQVNTVPSYSEQTDGHKIWYWDGQREVIVMNHQLKQGTTQIVCETDVPKAISGRAPV